MKQSQIAIEIFEDLFNEKEIFELSNKELVDVGENHQTRYPDNFPSEMSSPVIFNGYGEPHLPAEENNNEPIILGCYTPMNSPGVITFYKNNIKKYSSSLIRKVVNSGIISK